MGTENDCSNGFQIFRCVDQSPDGRFVRAGVEWITRQSTDVESVFFGHVDTESIAIGGWSMGGVSAIRAAATMSRNQGVRALILDSPSVVKCEALYNYTREQVQQAWTSASKNIESVLLVTASNDFLQPSTLDLFRSAHPSSGPQIYAQLPSERCNAIPPFYDTSVWPRWWFYFSFLEGWTGHCCSGLLSSSRLTTTFLKLTLQQHSEAGSRCHDLLWGGDDAFVVGEEAMAAFHRREGSAQTVVVREAPIHWAPRAYDILSKMLSFCVFLACVVVIPVYACTRAVRCVCSCGSGKSKGE